MTRTTCLWCGQHLSGTDTCTMCGPHPNVTCPKCGEDYFATGKGVCPICGLVWDEGMGAISVV